MLLKDGPLGPLHGVPFAVKDIIDTADMPTEYNSRLYRGSRPAQDAAAVSMLRSAGAILIGKTETIEFAAHGRNPVTRNPHDLTRTPGGSSSGSAAAVADLMVPLTLGTQTGGSVIRPASFCGVFGFKPTWGSISAEGAKLFSVTLDTIGWYARAHRGHRAAGRGVRDIERRGAAARGTEASPIARRPTGTARPPMGRPHSARRSTSCARRGRR